jgi:hypothetical protein
MYDPTIGRLISRDPLRGAIILPQTLNPYAYAGNDPTTLTDPSGNCVGPLVVVCAAVLGEHAAVAGGIVFVAALSHLELAPQTFEDANASVRQRLLDTGLLVSGVVFPEGIGGEDAAEAVSGAGLWDAAKGVHSLLDRVAQSLRTTAALRAVISDGTEVLVFASSERALTKAQRAAVEALSGVAAEGPGHAEVTAINEAFRQGLRPVEVAASRPICPVCAKITRDLGTEPVSPLR